MCKTYSGYAYFVIPYSCEDSSRLSLDSLLRKSPISSVIQLVTIIILAYLLFPDKFITLLGNFEAKCCSDAYFAFDRNGALMGFNNIFYNG